MNTGPYWNEGATSNPFAAGLGLNLGGDSYTIGGRGGGLGDVAGSHPGGGVESGDFGLLHGSGFPGQYSFPQERHGSLSQEQQMELMDVLETEGIGEIETFLSAGMGLGGGGIDGGVRWG